LARTLLFSNDRDAFTYNPDTSYEGNRRRL